MVSSNISDINLKELLENQYCKKIFNFFETESKKSDNIKDWSIAHRDSVIYLSFHNEAKAEESIKKWSQDLKLNDNDIDSHKIFLTSIIDGEYIIRSSFAVLAEVFIKTDIDLVDKQSALDEFKRALKKYHTSQIFRKENAYILQDFSSAKDLIAAESGVSVTERVLNNVTYYFLPTLPLDNASQLKEIFTKLLKLPPDSNVINICQSQVNPDYSRIIINKELIEKQFEKISRDDLGMYSSSYNRNQGYVNSLSIETQNSNVLNR